MEDLTPEDIVRMKAQELEGSTGESPQPSGGQGRQPGAPSGEQPGPAGGDSQLSPEDVVRAKARQMQSGDLLEQRPPQQQAASADQTRATDMRRQEAGVAKSAYTDIYGDDPQQADVRALREAARRESNDRVADALIRRADEAEIAQVPTSERIESAANTVVQGVAQVPANVSKGIGTAAYQINRQLGLREDDDLEDYATYQAGEQLTESTQETFPTDPRLEGTFESKVASGIGQGVSFAGGGAVSSLARGGAYAFPAIAGALQQGSVQYEDARDNYTPEDPELQAIQRKVQDGTATSAEQQRLQEAQEEAGLQAFLAGLGIGATEAVPIGNLINRFDKATGGAIKRSLREAAQEGGEESVQEFLNTISSDYAARALYDPDREISIQKALEGAAVGGISGSTLGGAAGTLSAATDAIRTQAERDRRNGNLEPSEAPAPPVLPQSADQNVNPRARQPQPAPGRQAPQRTPDGEAGVSGTEGQPRARRDAGAGTAPGQPAPAQPTSPDQADPQGGPEARQPAPSPDEGGTPGPGPQAREGAPAQDARGAGQQRVSEAPTDQPLTEEQAEQIVKQRAEAMEELGLGEIPSDPRPDLDARRTDDPQQESPQEAQPNDRRREDAPARDSVPQGSQDAPGQAGEQVDGAQEQAPREDQGAPDGREGAPDAGVSPAETGGQQAEQQAANNRESVETKATAERQTARAREQQEDPELGLESDPSVSQRARENIEQQLEQAESELQEAKQELREQAQDLQASRAQEEQGDMFGEQQETTQDGPREQSPERDQADMFGGRPKAGAGDFNRVLQPYRDRVRTAQQRVMQLREEAQRAEQQLRESEQDLFQQDAPADTPQYIEATDSTGNYRVAPTDDGRLEVIRREDGTAINRQSNQYDRVVAEYFAQNQSVVDGPTRTTEQGTFRDVDEAQRAVSERSTNPQEIVQAYLYERSRQEDLAGVDPQAQAIDDQPRFSTESFDDFGDPNWRQDHGQVRLNWLGGSKSLDQAAQEITQDTGIETTPQDIVEHILENPGGPQRRDPQSKRLQAMEERFRAVTGIKLTPELAEQIEQRRQELELPQEPITDEQVEAPFKRSRTADPDTRAERLVQSAIDELTLDGMPQPTVASSADQLPDGPRQVYESAQAEIGPGFSQPAMFYDGQVYLIADVMEAAARAEGMSLRQFARMTYNHEVVAHQGLRGLLGVEFRPTMERLADEVGEQRLLEETTRDGLALQDAYADQLTYDDQGNLTADSKALLMDEYLAQVAEGMAVEDSLWQRIKRILTDAIRRLRGDVTEQELRLLLQASRDHLRNEQYGSPTSATRFMIAGPRAVGNAYPRASQAGRTFEAPYDPVMRFEISDQGADLAADGPLHDFIQTGLEIQRLQQQLDRDGQGDLFEQEIRQEIQELRNSFNALYQQFYGNDASVRLQDILNHEELFNAYPELRGVPVRLRKGMDARGAHRPFDNRITLSASFVLGMTRGGADSRTAAQEDVLGTLLHEAQHAIQSVESTPRGTGTNTERGKAKRELNRAKVLYRKYKRERPYLEFHRRIEQTNQTPEAAASDVLTLYPRLQNLGAEKFVMAAQNKYDSAAEVGANMRDKAEQLNEIGFNIQNQGDLRQLNRIEEQGVPEPLIQRRAKDRYLQSAGEIEAREVEERLRWTDEERRATLPFRDPDTGELKYQPEEVNVRFQRLRSDGMPTDSKQQDLFFGVEGLDPTTLEAQDGPQQSRAERLQQEFRERMEAGQDEPANMIVLHNLNDSNIRWIRDYLDGSIPMPSLAVTKYDNEFSSYGQITLVGRPEMVDPGSAPVFDADIYSPRTPDIEFQADEEAVQQLESRFRSLAGDHAAYLWKKSSLNYYLNNGKRDKLERDLQRSIPGLLLYLDQRGQAPAPDQFPSGAPGGEHSALVQTGPVDGFLSGLTKSERLNNMRAYQDNGALKDAIIEGYQERAANQLEGSDIDTEADLEQLVEIYLDGTGLLDYYKGGIKREEATIKATLLDGIGRKHVSVQNNPDQVNRSELKDQLRQRIIEIGSATQEIPSDLSDLAAVKEITQNWARETADRMVSDQPVMKDGGQPMTIDRLVEQMQELPIRGGEGLMGSLGAVRASGAQQFESMEDVKGAREQLTNEDHMDALKEELNHERGQLEDLLREHYIYEGGFSYRTEFHGALADAYQRGLTAQGVRRAYREFGFEDVPKRLVQRTIDFLRDLRKSPTQYFEAKPKRAVNLSEFRAAVVPADTPQDVQEYLQDEIGEVRTYEERSERTEKVSDFPDVRFQRVNGGDSQAERIGEGPDLMAVHNLSPRGIEFAVDKMDGAIPAPSVAISDADAGFTEFGRVSLVGTPDLIDPSTSATFGADAYTPTTPRIRQQADPEAVEGVKERVRDRIMQMYERLPGEVETFPEDSSDPVLYSAANVIENDANRTLLRRLDKIAQGNMPLESRNSPGMAMLAAERYDLDLASAIENAASQALEGRPDGQDGRPEFDETELRAAFLEDVKGQLESQGRKWIDVRDIVTTELQNIPVVDAVQRGFAGNRNTTPLGEDPAGTVADFMTRNGVRAAQSSNQRAMAVRRYRTLEELQRDRGRIDATMSGNAPYQRAQELMEDAQETITGSELQARASDPPRADDIVNDALKIQQREGLPRTEAGTRQAVRQALDGFLYRPDDPDVFAPDRPAGTDQIINDVAGVIDYLREGKTDYFEAKPPRKVELSEFAAAIIPEDLSQKYRTMLEEAGLKTREYGHSKGRVSLNGESVFGQIVMKGGNLEIGARIQDIEGTLQETLEVPEFQQRPLEERKQELYNAVQSMLQETTDPDIENLERMLEEWEDVTDGGDALGMTLPGKTREQVQREISEDMGVRFQRRDSAPDPDNDVPPQALTPGWSLTDIRALGKGFIRRELATRGELPQDVFEAKLERDNGLGAGMKRVEYTIRDYRDAIRDVFGREELTESEASTIRDVLRGQEDPDVLPKPLRDVVLRMRQQIDALTDAAIQAGAVTGDMAVTYEENKGVYVTRTYEAVTNTEQWQKEVPQEVINDAEKYLRQEMQPTTEERVQGMIDKLLGKHEDTNPLAAWSESKLGSTGTAKNKRREDIPKVIRELLGEQTSPLTNYRESMYKMLPIVQNQKLLNQIKDRGLDRYLFEKPVRKGGVSFSKQIAADQSETMHPLNGLYTTPEIARAFEEIDGTQTVNNAYRQYMKAIALVKGAKTIGSVRTQIRNYLGNILFGMRQGHFFNPAGAADAKGKAFSTVAADLGARTGDRLPSWASQLRDVAQKGDTEARRQYYQKLKRLGVVDESVRAGELEDIFKDANLLYDDPQKGSDTLLNRAWKGTAKTAEDLYTAGDDIWKIFAFEREKSRYAKAKPDWSQEKVEERAARIVRDTYPTYSLVPKLSKRFRASPVFASFVSFTSEVFRTTYHSARIIKEEMKDPDLQPIAGSRVAGSVLAYAAPIMAAGAARGLTNISPGDDEDLRSFMPPWEKFSTIIYLGRDEENGSVEYMDGGYLNPFGTMYEPITALSHKADEDPMGAATTALHRLLEPYASEEILTSKLIDLMRNRTQLGGNVYNTESDEWMVDALWHVYEAVEPGTVYDMRRIYKAGQDQTERYGVDRELETELTSLVSGARIKKLDLRQAMQWQARDYARKWNKTTQLFTSVVTRRGTVNESEVREAYREMVEGKRKLVEKLNTDVTTAERFGVPVGRTRQVLTENGIGSTRASKIIQGDYFPEMRTNVLLGRIRAEAAAGNTSNVQALRDRREKVLRVMQEERRRMMSKDPKEKEKELEERRKDLEGEKPEALGSALSPPITRLAGEAYTAVMKARMERVTPATYNHTRAAGQIMGTVEPYPSGTNRMLDREDAFAIYRGEEQKHNTFKESPYSPSNADDPDKTYYAYQNERNREQVRNLAQRFLYGWEDGRRIANESEMEGTLLIENDSTASAVDAIVYEGEDGRPVPGTQYAEDEQAEGPIRTGTLGQFQLQKGEDEHGKYISYYDVWDLGAGEYVIPDEAGEPFEVYGRLYYDPDTNELLPPNKQPRQ